MTRECRVCLAEHDAEIHDATARIHAWFRAQVTHDFEEEGDAPASGNADELDLPRINAA